MTEPIPFLSPHLVGARFEGHAIPLEVLKDLAVLEELVVEVAKWHYLQEHPDRKRSPRGFTDGVSLKLTEVDDGSAIARISLFITAAAAGLFPPENQEYFERARTSIISAINAAEQGESISHHLSDNNLAYFDKIGRSLRDGEAIEFDHENRDRPATLNKATRRKLTLASSRVQEFTEEVVLRGTIPEADQQKGRFHLALIDGRRVTAPLDSPHYDAVLEAFAGYRNGVRVALKGIAKFDLTERIREIETVEHFTVLETNDVAARLDDLRLLKNGWLDGKGVAPTSDFLDWLTERLESLYPDDLPAPFLYPTAEGGVQAEWTVGAHEISLEISLEQHRGEWHDLNLETQEDSERELNLDDPQQWSWIAGQIRNGEGAGQ